ncbi:uncharacterized protein LOC111462775 isoform X2 [Cucurbita moschata]|uniref:Uncharacterized protein LOC111462775 isoform X2 n=1 Tax=Cucurbita moschata TaxID=3662 RepID=A0A6J1HCP0_CUCMO|nr:uncharacterized protein LOC111462775 isoform X2 [Cucurbita moschata]
MLMLLQIVTILHSPIHPPNVSPVLPLRRLLPPVPVRVFDDEKNHRHAVFMSRFDGDEEEFRYGETETTSLQRNATVLCSINNHSTSSSVGSSGGSSSMLDWATVMESELGGCPSEPQHHQSFKTVFWRNQK